MYQLMLELPVLHVVNEPPFPRPERCLAAVSAVGWELSNKFLIGKPELDIDFAVSYVRGSKR
jgi:hypothetical protein